MEYGSTRVLLRFVESESSANDYRQPACVGIPWNIVPNIFDSRCPELQRRNYARSGFTLEKELKTRNGKVKCCRRKGYSPTQIRGMHLFDIVLRRFMDTPRVCEAFCSTYAEWNEAAYANVFISASCPGKGEVFAVF